MDAAVGIGPATAVLAPARQPTRVLIVDDSAVARAIFARLLSDGSDIKVVGEAASAAGAIGLLGSIAVDVILLDLEMPGRGGLDALPELIARGGGARVLVVSSSCSDGAVAAIKALGLGAADTLAKPGTAAFSGRFADELRLRLRRLATAPPSLGPAGTPPEAADVPAPANVAVVGIASSTGGVHALGGLLTALPSSFTLPLLVTQHLPVPFMPFFARQLEEMSGRRARVAATGMLLNRNEILLAPGDAHLTLARTGGLVHVRLADGRSASGCMPSADPMLASLATVYRHRAVAVVLSGMGRDGADGAADIAGEGGRVLAQDAASSVVWGMPGAVVQRGIAGAVAPPAGLAAMLSAFDRPSA